MTFRQLRNSSLVSKRILRGADGSCLNVAYQNDLTISSKRGNKINTIAYVVINASNNLMGKDEIQSLGLISVINSI